jgi:hypothetical protein
MIWPTEVGKEQSTLSTVQHEDYKSPMPSELESVLATAQRETRLVAARHANPLIRPPLGTKGIVTSSGAYRAAPRDVELFKPTALGRRPQAAPSARLVADDQGNDEDCSAPVEPTQIQNRLFF